MKFVILITIIITVLNLGEFRTRENDDFWLAPLSVTVTLYDYDIMNIIDSGILSEEAVVYIHYLNKGVHETLQQRVEVYLHLYSDSKLKNGPGIVEEELGDYKVYKFEVQLTHITSDFLTMFYIPVDKKGKAALYKFSKNVSNKMTDDDLQNRLNLFDNKIKFRYLTVETRVSDDVKNDIVSLKNSKLDNLFGELKKTLVLINFMKQFLYYILLISQE
jgi:hypothetical protein